AAISGSQVISTIRFSIPRTYQAVSHMVICILPTAASPWAWISSTCLFWCELSPEKNPGTDTPAVLPDPPSSPWGSAYGSCVWPPGFQVHGLLPRYRSGFPPSGLLDSTSDKFPGHTSDG